MISGKCSTKREPLYERLPLYILTAFAAGCVLFAVTPVRQLLGISIWLAGPVGGFGIVIIVYVVRRVERDQLASAEAVTAGREPLTAEEFATRYFSGEAISVAARCHELFAENYRFDSSRIHPDDKLCADLRFAADDCLDAEDFILAIQGEFHVTFTICEMRLMLTLRDIVTAVLRKRRNDA